MQSIGKYEQSKWPDILRHPVVSVCEAHLSCAPCSSAYFRRPAVFLH